MRDEIKSFAQLMQKKIDGKAEERGGDSWKNADNLMLRAYIKAKTEILIDVLLNQEDYSSDAILEAAVNVGNAAMFIADVYGGLPEPD